MNDKTPRYFYNCPIMAAFMAKYHGMKFWGFELTQEVDKDLFGPLKHDVDHTYLEMIVRVKWPKDSIPDKPVKFYVSPDSLPILEAQDEDITYEKGWGYNEFWALKEMKESVDNEKLGSSFKIIQRNGKAFMSPEVEE